MTPGHDDVQATLRDQQEQLARQAALLEEQAALIRRLEDRLAAVEAPKNVPATDRSPATPAATELRTDRRGMLRTVGAAAAGVATGAVVLGQASPAAAAQGVFDGNPGVVGTANPNTGLGVRGDTITGTGVQGRSQAAVGPALGVEGLVAGTLSTAVKGNATATTSATFGVVGQVASPDGIGVLGTNTVNSAFSSSPGVGVKGSSAGANGTGVLGEATGSSSLITDIPTGVEGRSGDRFGVGILGDATSATGTSRGVLGQAISPDGVAVLAENLSPSGPAVALLARTSALGSRAVDAINTATSGFNLAIRALAEASPDATAVFASGGRRGVTAKATGADGIALELQNGKSHLRFSQPKPPPLGSALAFTVGELLFDTAGDLWLCTAAGTPGQWRRVSGASTAGSLVLLNTPVRVYDSRPGEAPLNSVKGPIAGNTTRVVDMANNSSGVPAGASGVLCTLTVVNTSANGGFLALFKNGAATPATSTVNWSAANQVVATTTVTAVDATAKAQVFCPPNSTTNFFLDVIGFYQ